MYTPKKWHKTAIIGKASIGESFYLVSPKNETSSFASANSQEYRQRKYKLNFKGSFGLAVKPFTFEVCILQKIPMPRKLFRNSMMLKHTQHRMKSQICQCESYSLAKAMFGNNFE